MQRLRSWPRFAVMGVVATAAFALLVGGCGEDETADNDTLTEVDGGTGTLFGGELRASAMMDETGNVQEVRLFLPMMAIENGPEAEFDPTAPPPTDTSGLEVRLPLPSEVSETTFVNYVSVDYNPAGHPPMDVYTRPHFDFHFYAIPSSEVEAIDCTDTTPIAAKRVPANYVVSEDECVPGMGLHGVDTTSPELAPNNPEPFMKTMILGYYAGMPHFIEPMITKEYLMRRQDFTIPIPKPSSVGRSTRYPTSFVAMYDADKDGYVLALRDFVETQ